jgi:hypothetical protein
MVRNRLENNYYFMRATVYSIQKYLQGTYYIRSKGMRPSVSERKSTQACMNIVNNDGKILMSAPSPILLRLVGTLCQGT